MGKRNLVNPQDYARYTLEPKSNPWVYVFSRKRLHNFVFTELEKKHPFFGNHCTVDYKVSFINKKLCIKVSVIDTIVLANKKVFTTKARILCYGLSVLLFASLLCTCLLPLNEEKSVDILSQTKEQIPDSYFNDFFSIMGDLVEQNARCTSLSFSRNSIDQNTDITSIKIDLIGVLPENFYSLASKMGNGELQKMIQISDIHFENNIPSLSISFSEKYILTNNTHKTNISTDFLTNSVIRNIILDAGGIIYKENTSKRIFDFSIPVLKWDEFFNTITVFLDENAIGFSQCNFDLTSEIVAVTIGLNESFQNSKDLYIKNLFKQEQKVSTIKKMDVPIAKKQLPSIESVKPIEKIGSITRANGSVLVFHLNNEGKLISEEKK